MVESLNETPVKADFDMLDLGARTNGGLPVTVGQLKRKYIKCTTPHRDLLRDANNKRPSNSFMLSKIAEIGSGSDSKRLS